MFSYLSYKPHHTLSSGLYQLVTLTLYNSDGICPVPIVIFYPTKSGLLLLTPFTATRFAMHRIYANRINSRGMSRVYVSFTHINTSRDSSMWTVTLILNINCLYQILHPASMDSVHTAHSRTGHSSYSTAFW